MRALLSISVVALLLVPAGASADLPPAGGLCGDFKAPDAKAGDLGAAEAAADKAWAGRKDVAKLQTAIAKWREAVAIAPKKTANYVKLAKALYFLADGYLRFDEDKEDDMLKAFEDAIVTAANALALQNGDFIFSVCSREPVKTSAKLLRKGDIPAVYWYATALGKYGLAKSIVIVLDNKDKIYAIMRRVRKMAPEYNHGAADRYLGAFHTKIPFPKGDLVKSRKYFERSLKRSPNYLSTHVLMAQMLAPKLKDRALFKEHVDFVMKAPLNIIPGMEAEHAIEKRKAATLLEDIDTIFVPAE